MKKTVIRGGTSCGLALFILEEGVGRPWEQQALGLVLQRPEDCRDGSRFQDHW